MNIDNIKKIIYETVDKNNINEDKNLKNEIINFIADLNYKEILDKDNYQFFKDMYNDMIELSPCYDNLTFNEFVFADLNDIDWCKLIQFKKNTKICNKNICIWHTNKPTLEFCFSNTIKIIIFYIFVFLFIFLIRVIFSL